MILHYILLSSLITLLCGYPDGTSLQLYTCDGSDRQSWNYNAQTQLFTLRADSKCIDISGYSSDNGAVVWLYDCHTSDTDPTHQNQEWKINTDRSIQNPMTGKCLDANAYGTSPGTAVQLWQCTGADNQKWVYNSQTGTIVGVQSNLCVDAGSLLPRPCDITSNKNLPFCDVSLSFDQRVQDLVGRIPQNQKYGLLVNGASGVPALNISGYQWWSEALHGVAYSPGVHFGANTPYATSFPQIIGMGASFDMPLVNKMATTISDEARGMNFEHTAGLTYWAPNVNIIRDPRWGRGQETPGEDPYLTSQYAYNFVTGLQGGTNNHYLKVSSCCKHYTAYDLEDWNGVDRHHFNAIVTEQDLTDTFMPSFKTCVENAQATSIMCSYNEVNGIPSCANHLYNTDYLRTQWGFQGYVTGDCGAVDDVYSTHKYTNTTDQTCYDVLYSGLDTDCGGFLSSHLQQANSDGSVSNTLINTALTHLFLVQMRLGMFDPDSIQPYRKLNASNVNTPTNQALALTAARETMVLLKNEGSVLPFDKSKIKTIALIGPNAQATGTMQANYNGAAPYLISPQAGLAKYATVKFAKGCDINSSDRSGFTAACNAASSADATILVMGIDQSIESEGKDRTSIALPGVQNDLITQVATCSKGPIIVVIMTGGQLDLTTAKNTAKVAGILWVGYPGQSGGDAIAQTIFGDNNPAGRLPYTLYPASYVNQVSMFDMGMRPNSTNGNPGRTYRFYTGTPVYEFGTGLTYTTFTAVISNSSPLKFQYDLIDNNLGDDVTSSWKAMPLADITITITNTGNKASDYVALGYVTPPNAGKDGNPLKYLVGFSREHNIQPGQKVVVTIPVTTHDISLVNQNGIRETYRGEWIFQIEDQKHSIYVI